MAARRDAIGAGQPASTPEPSTEMPWLVAWEGP